MKYYVICSDGLSSFFSIIICSVLKFSGTVFNRIQSLNKYVIMIITVFDGVIVLISNNDESIVEVILKLYPVFKYL